MYAYEYFSIYISDIEGLMWDACKEMREIIVEHSLDKCKCRVFLCRGEKFLNTKKKFKVHTRHWVDVFFS